MQPEVETKSHVLVITLGIIVLLLVLGAGAYYYYATPATEDEAELSFSERFRNAFRSADPSIVETLPEPSSLEANSAADAQYIFDVSRLASGFKVPEKNLEYLGRILDSDSPDVDMYKSLSAYFVLHTYYDTRRDIDFMIDAVEKTEFTQALTPRAQTVFPDSLELFTTSTSEMTFFQETLYFTSYLVALSEVRADSLAAPANASYEIATAYIDHMYSDDSQKDPALGAAYEALLHDQLGKTLDRIATTFGSESTSSTISAYETVVGLNNVATAINYLRDAGLADEFPEIENINTTAFLAASYDIARREVIPLDLYTTYKYALQLAKYSEDTDENNERLDMLVQRIIGDAPFENVGEYSWATGRLIGARVGPFYNPYRKENHAAIARRSPTMREFLIMKDGWTDTDFELQDTYRQ